MAPIFPGHQVNRDPKLPLQTLSRGHGCLRRAWCSGRRRRVHEFNWVLDTPELSLRSGGQFGCVFRKRWHSGDATLKGPAAAGRQSPGLRLRRMSPAPNGTQKSWSTWATRSASVTGEVPDRVRQRRSSEGFITLDETPIGAFLEIEGGGDWIDQTASLLRIP